MMEGMVLWLAGGLVGLVGAALLARTAGWRTSATPLRVAVAVAAVGVAVLGATLGLMTQETLLYVDEGLTEAGHPRNAEPPFPEPFVAAVEQALADGETWELTTPAGRCDADRYSFIWLSFRLHPAVPSCDGDADVRLYYATPAPADARSVARTDEYAIVR